MPKNIRKYYFLRFLSGFIFTYTIQSIFLISRGISLTQLALYASIMVITSTIMEIPTGFIADKFGRKYSVSISYFIDALVFLAFTFINDFNLLIFVAILKGIAVALESGAYESLIFEEVQVGGSKDNFLKVTTKGSNIAIGVGIIATFFGPILYSYNHNLPFILCSLIYCVMAGFILTFEEHSPPTEVENNLKIFDGIKSVIKVRPLLIIILVDLTLLVFVSIYYRVAFFPKINNLGLDVKYFGIVDVITLGIASLFLFLIPKISWKNDKQTLSIFSLLVGLIFFLFGISRTLIPTLIFGMLFDPIWSVRKHLIPTITNKYFSNQNRALSLSTMSFLSNFGSALLVPIATILFTKNYLFSLIPLGIIMLLLYKFPSQNDSSKI